jgi:hypothetical protein
LNTSPRCFQRHLPCPILEGLQYLDSVRVPIDNAQDFKARVSPFFLVDEYVLEQKDVYDQTIIYEKSIQLELGSR